jgi:shikimate kinase
MKNYKRIFITGNAGAGKTTLAKHLSDILDIKFTSLDSIVAIKLASHTFR